MKIEGFNPEKLTLPQLKELQASLPELIQARQNEEHKKAQLELEALARQLGFELGDFTRKAPGGQSQALGKQRKPAAVKYRHPENHALTWTGRGRSPKWVTEFVASGRKLDEATIDKEPKAS